MTAARRKYVIYGILVVTVIWGIYNNPFASKEKAVDDGYSTEPAPAPVIESEKIAAVSHDMTVPEQYDEWGHDPFPRKTSRPVVYEKATVAEKLDFKLSAISESGSKVMAIINGKIVQKGGEIDDWIVAEIDNDRVVMNRGAEKVELKLNRR
jgi:hypothetical protein